MRPKYDQAAASNKQSIYEFRFSVASLEFAPLTVTRHILSLSDLLRIIVAYRARPSRFSQSEAA
jgi:hypothetical protein